ncbi:MAG TPA: competence/damage-inducible protein A [Deltaproteobacteria bacterium]|nr:competence/damage-inducible protein A [Candidatus Binatota bacterium]HIL13162.1 competence/damage-inducible protein A [Deltaproteobacteria bacterium]
MIKTAAIISTGDELTSGRTTDTNSNWLADRLSAEGVEVVSVITVGDDSERISWAWQAAMADVVISTGGLGPTADDLTTETVARFTGRKLLLDEEQADAIRGFFDRVGRSMPDNNLKQAMFPEGAVPLPNQRGTAPGYRFDIEGGAVGVVLPGVPHEMKAMFEEQVLPWLRGQADADRRFVSRTFQTFGMSESALDEALLGAIDPARGRLAFRASFPDLSVRVSVAGQPEAAERELDELSKEVHRRLGDAVYAEGDTTMQQEVGQLLSRRGLTLGTAESCTGGLISRRLTDVAGCSDYYTGGIVAYSQSVKEKVLGVSGVTLAMYGAVSEETVAEMALGARRLSGADLAVAVSGIAGPGGGSDDKPVGTVCIGMAGDLFSEGAFSGGEVSAGEDIYLEGGACARTYNLGGNREWIRVLSSQLALDWTRRYLLGLEPWRSGFGVRRSG